MNHLRTFDSRSRRRRLATIALAAVTLAFSIGAASAHGPDPTLGGGTFAQNQDLRFRWRAGAVPSAAIQAAVKAAAADANASRGSKAATFTYDAAGSNPIGYGAGATCGVNGLACFTRDAPSGFTIWLREQGHVFDWGTLKWCQAYATAPNGCYDAETTTLDELGHVEGLGHHVNTSNDSDYQDAVVQTYSRTKPSAGWNQHAFGRCDVATLQMLYDMTSWTARYSTCLDLSTTLTLAASPTTVVRPGSTTLTATLKVTDKDAYLRLGGDPVSARTVILQGRDAGVSSWSTVGAMATGSASGSYVTTATVTANTEFRAVFATPSNEGINGSTSATVLVYAITPCKAALAGAAMPAAACLP